MKLPATWKAVQFFDLDSDNPLQCSSQIASESECKTALEKSAFRAACEVEDIVCMGRLVCKPVYKSQPDTIKWSEVL